MLSPVVVFAKDNYYTNYYGIEMSKEEYDNLVELGFSESEIYYMLEDDFIFNKDIEGHLVADTTNYYVNIIRYDATGRIVSNSDMQVSKDDYENGLPQPISYDGYIETSYKKMRTTISSGTKFRYKVNLVWKSMPAVRSYDIIGIGMEELVYINSALSFSQTYCSTPSFCKTDTTVNSTIINPTGAGASFLLPSSKEVTSLQSTFYFDVSKNVSSTLTLLYAHGDYAHATKSLSGGSAQGFIVNIGGIQLASGITSYYDTMDRATAKWTGSW